jgi:4,5-DOPA dioxygenase extradiol
LTNAWQAASENIQLTVPMTLLPTLFVSHGSPMLALQPGSTGPALEAWARENIEPKLPSAVLVVSPHWSTQQARVGTMARQRAWHDFGGFPPELYTLEYSPPGDPDFAQRVIALLEAGGLPAAGDEQRPLDHGAWVPLRYLRPAADIPVVQLSLQPHLSPARQFAIGRLLAPLRDEGVLIFGSGSYTHNLSELDGGVQGQVDETPSAPWVDEFRNWFDAHVQAGDINALDAYRTLAPHAHRAHPTDEHLLPLFVAWGAAGEAAVPHRFNQVVTHGTLSMDAYEFIPA